MALEIRTFPDPFLQKKARKIKKITPRHHQLAREMVQTMRSHDGVGLAANQIGVLERMAVVQTPDMEQPIVLVNPEIVAREGTRDLREACLSLPERSGVTTRSRSTLVRALGLDANRFRLRANGLLAQVLEHEIDHLDGVLYPARLVPAAWSPSSEDSSDPNRDTTGPR